jgi:23S rRNA (guanosine2251-2'-O)-methyltransferase
MLVSGRNNVKEVLRNFCEIDSVRKAYCQDNFNENDILTLLKKRNIKINYMKKQELDRLVKNNHQGVILDVRDFAYTSLDDIIANKEDCFLVILDHIEDPHNLGAIIRTVEASGADGIILPINRSVSVNETVMKTSVGALYNVKIASVTNLNNTIKRLKKEGFWIVGTDMDGEDYTKIKYPKKTALIIGSEGFGMTRIVKESCDFIASIPMKGKVNSLNASVAAGIMIYEVIKR